MLVLITFCATRGRPLPNWIERSVRESRTNFTSCHQVACSGVGSIPLLKIGKVTVVCDSSERSAGRGFENCAVVVSSGRPDVNNRMIVVILQRKYTSIQITNLPWEGHFRSWWKLGFLLYDVWFRRLIVGSRQSAPQVVPKPQFRINGRRIRAIEALGVVSRSDPGFFGWHEGVLSLHGGCLNDKKGCQPLDWHA